MLALAFPNIISNISIPLLSTVDTALMGRLSDLHIGAVGLAAMIFNFFYWNFGFLRMATTGFTAQFYGKADRTGQIMQFARGVLLAITLALFFLVFQQPLGNAAFHLMNVGDDILPLVREYFFIRIWDVPATLALMVIMGWFFGMQNAIAPLIITILVNVVNISLSYYFVAILQWDVAGVAYGTVIAQYFGVLLALSILVFKYKHLFPMFQSKLLLSFRNWGDFFRVNSDIFLRTLALTLVFAFFYSVSADMGPMVLAVNVILMQFVNWMSYGIDGFAYATESLVGKYKGKESESDLNITLDLAFIWAGLMAVLCALGYFIFGVDLLRIFTDVDEVIQAAIPYLFWMAIIPLAGFWSYVWDGIYIGLTASKSMRNAMILSFLLFFGMYYLGGDSPSNNWLWASLITFLVVRAVMQWIWFRKYRYQLK